MLLLLPEYSETEVGTKSDQNLATGQVLYQKHLGTAATLIKGGTQEAKFHFLGTARYSEKAGRRGVSARGEEPCHLRLREREGRIRPGSKPAQDSPGVLALGGRGSRPPAPTTGLRNERQKLQPLCLTLAFSLQVGALMGLIGVDSVCSKRTASTHPRRDCKVESSRFVEAPLRHVDVSGAAVSGTAGSRVATILVGPQREETGLFDLDGEDGPEAVVALHAVTTAGAAT